MFEKKSTLSVNWQRNYWNKKAPEWQMHTSFAPNDWFDSIPFCQIQAITREHLLPLDEQEFLLDVPSGATSSDYLPQFSRGRPVAGDWAKEMLKLHEYQHKAQMNLNAPFPFASEIFSAVTSFFGLRYTNAPSLVLNEMIRVLKPHGRLLIVDFENPGEKIHPEHIVTQVFSLLHIREQLTHAGMSMLQQGYNIGRATEPVGFLVGEKQLRV